MRNDLTKFAPPTISGDGFFDAYIDLDQAPHARVTRYNDESEQLRRAITVSGCDLAGGNRDGQCIYEVNSYAPRGVVESDGDRCILATLEFHSVRLLTARSGSLHFKGFLGAAESYTQGIFDRIRDGEDLGQIPELASEYGGIRYLPPTYTSLED